MITISNQIRDFEPDSWYNFKKDDINISFDLSKPLGVDPDNSYLFNAINTNYFIPTWNRPCTSFTSVDTRYTSNQLADSEYLLENDSSILCGRNSSRMGGLLYREYSDQIESLDDVLYKIDSNEIREYFFQIRPSTTLSKRNYITMPYEGDESFIPMVLDSSSTENSFAVNRYYTNTKGRYEIWSSEFDIVSIQNGGVTTDEDKRDITFALVNPVTGNNIGNSRTYIFDRSVSLNSLNSDEVKNIFNDQNIYEQQELADKNKTIFELAEIYVYSNSKYYRLKTNGSTKLSIPKVEKIFFLIKTPYFFNDRSFELSDITAPLQEDFFMEFLGYKFYYSNVSNRIKLYDVDKESFVSNDFNAPKDSTSLVYIKAYYEKLALHNPSTGYFNYNMVINIRFITGESYTFRREYKGGVKEILYKGVTKIQSIPSYDSYPHMMGHMPTIKFDYKYDSGINKEDIDITKKINMPINGNLKEIMVPNKLNYICNSVIIAVDNFCFFTNKNMQNNIDKLYYTQFREDNSLLNNTLIQYWPMLDIMTDNLRRTRNTVNSGVYQGSGYDLYGYMNFSGIGNIRVDKDYHNVIKGSIYFDGAVLGNSNTFITWSNNNNYSINFWFKSDQKTKGVILCDMNKESVSTAGIYIGIAQGGNIEIAFNTLTSQIFQKNITDNIWHMITVVCTNTSSYKIYVDGVLLSEVNSTTGVQNKNAVTNYQTYFMGHPLGKYTKGSLARVGFYGSRIDASRIKDMFEGDIEHRIYGTVLASNMPIETEIRFYNHYTGQYVNSSFSDLETGKFIYRNYDGYSIDLIVVNNNRKYGTIQVMGPLTPSSVPN